MDRAVQLEMFEEGRSPRGDEHRSVLASEFRDFRKCAQQSHQSRFPAGARMHANQAQIVATFRFLTVFTAHCYFFQFHICTSLHMLRTPLRRHLEVFSFITPFAFPLHSTSFSLFPLVSIVILLSLFVLFIVLAFSFRVSWFLYLILHICIYTRPFQRDYTEEISFPFVFRTSCVLGALTFHFLSPCAHRRNILQHPSHPFSFLEPNSHPSRTITCLPQALLFCFV